ncbi:general secretion pathway protein F/type IV pilus assembly protein PilC [Prosthecobacter fusiformis]|uniref:General secretion pathway protein F/type IV pilus assembly protein PilC n=1 Tax=Prosthecobacter fusiformis TaxID=48464 RepID=A0A4R7S3G7_9BACT|nr:type II secretion system F family protein [Prosthecobacter fusiformis]TDU72930.1 general secretion pathway protein F/type IV pilus assembly protein PilC [Prosthecobacter fusiformis]
MPSFSYTALNATGQTVTGSLAVGSKAEAFRKLEAQALTPVKVAEEAKSAKSAAETAAKTLDNQPVRLKRAQIILFTEELADMLDGGLQIDQALRVIAERQEDVGLRRVSAILRDQLREGSSVSKALKKASPSFDELYCNLVAAGEVSGSLPEILRRLAQNLVVMAELQAKVTSAMIYPAFLIGACIVLMIVFMTVMVPQITDLLAKSGQKLPFATQMLISFNNFLAQWWWLMLTVIITVSLSFKAYVATPKGLMWWHETRLKLPLFGPVIATRFYAQFAHSMGSLVGNGVPLLNSIRLVSKISANVYIQSLLAKVTGLVAEGGALSNSLKKVSHFPMTLIDMIAVGEQTGMLGRSLEKAAARYDKELDKRIKRMTALISPIIIVFMAVIVGVVAYSIISAVFQSVNGIKSRV